VSRYVSAGYYYAITDTLWLMITHLHIYTKKGKGLGICYSNDYMSSLMTSSTLQSWKCMMWPSIACISEHLDLWCSPPTALCPNQPN